MRRFSTACLALFLLWALVPGAGELIENTVHLAREGHAAHAAADGDDHDPVGPEHCCTGAVHLCSCCASVSGLATLSAFVVTNRNPGDYLSLASAQVSPVTGPGIYHPPRV